MKGYLFKIYWITSIHLKLEYLGLVAYTRGGRDMVIVITMHKLSYTKECMDELYDRYHNRVRKFNRLANTITFANGDIIKGYSVDSRRDGLRADVAIGVGAEYLTCRSNILEPVWDEEKLYKYLDEVKISVERYLQRIEKDVVDGTGSYEPIGICPPSNKYQY